MKSFTFAHVADCHLGYAQYNLEERRDDFSEAFRQVVDFVVEAKPSFMVIAGDLFDNPRPSNVVLATAIRELRRLKDAGVFVLATNGSHDYSPNVMTGSILAPLDEAGLIHLLPRRGSWEGSGCYVYGMRNFRSRLSLEEGLPGYYADNPPKPVKDKFNVFVFHQALEHPMAAAPHMAEMRVDFLPEGFQYYAAGHIHKPIIIGRKTSKIVYSGSIETVFYTEAGEDKGFFMVHVASDGDIKLERVHVKARPFKVIEEDYSGLAPTTILAKACELVKKADSEGSLIVVVLKGTLPLGVKPYDIDHPRIEASKTKSLHIHIINKLIEQPLTVGVKEAEELMEAEDLKAKARKMFLKVFLQRYPVEKANRLASLAIEAMEDLKAKKSEEGLKKKIEEALKT